MVRTMTLHIKVAFQFISPFAANYEKLIEAIGWNILLVEILQAA